MIDLQLVAKSGLEKWQSGLAFIVSSWGFIWLCLNDSMSEWYFGGYMLAWAGASYLNARMKAQGVANVSSVIITDGTTGVGAKSP
jgi:hypothetical protein